MPLEALPDAVIARLRAQCAAFANRVAGTATEAELSEQSQFAVPHAFYQPGSIEPGEGDELSPLDQHVTVEFRVAICVDNTSDTRGQAGAAALMARVGDVVAALVGHTPASGFSPILFVGLEDDFPMNRARLWGTALFRTSTTTSNF